MQDAKGVTMRKLLIVLAVVFALSVFAAALAQAVTATTKMPAKSKMTAKAKCPTMHRASTTAKHKTMASKKPKCYKVTKWHCPKKHTVRRAARPAAAARGPVVTCPSPVVNVPQRPAPVVNVPQQAAPIVNVPASPPTVGITVDNCFIYVVRENQLMVIDKNTYELKKTVPLQ
jgi:Tfp pilus assembly protein PilE